jgi:hypothetical protein
MAMYYSLELLPMLVLVVIEILPPLGKYKYDSWRILPVKWYIDNSVRLRRCIRNVYTLEAKFNTLILCCLAITVSNSGDWFPNPGAGCWLGHY